MNRLFFSVVLSLMVVSIGLVASVVFSADQGTVSNADRLFVNRVQPLFKTKCLSCHGADPDELKGELDMRTRAGLLAGGESEDPSLVPGRPDDSPLYQAVNWDGLEMPPKENDRLTAEQIGWLRDWIVAGAPWPDEKTIARIQRESWEDAATDDGVIVATSGGQSDTWTNRRYQPDDLWAYQPVLSPTVPASSDHGTNPIDFFINAKIKAAKLKPAAPASRGTLIRRATYDLTGLPPTLEEIEAFLADQSPNAFQRLVDRLLASPRYGEQMARHWLDVVRYADSAGFSNDFARPSAWRYRDYVIRSFNDNQPYDQFIRQQIAGDEIDPDDPENLIAVGFLRMGPWEHTGMSVAAVTRQQFLDDVTNSVGVTFLATELRCCQCHDHKFDPLPQQDYYRFQAAFAPVQFADRDVPFLAVENTKGIDAGRARLERLLKDDGIKLVVPPEFTKEQREEAALGVGKVKKKQKQIRQRALNRFKPLALSVYNGPLNNYSSNRPLNPMPKKVDGRPQEIFILAGGSIESPGAKVSPSVLSAIPVSLSGNTNAPAAPRTRESSSSDLPDSMTGRRLALANWIADSKNPLTARVIVNRIWQWHFGRGLAANPNNFGRTGSRPTHPELLDYLASEFVRSGWSIKRLHRLIMTSDTYLRGGSPPDLDALAKADPDNKLLTYFRPRRLTAEEIRDSMLAASGELNLEMGGVPIRPEINMEIAMQPRHVMGSVASAYQPSRTPAKRNRRTIYALKIRTLRDPMLEVFDQPSPDISCERRDSSTITPQVFSLLNSQSSANRALAMAARIAKEESETAGRVQAAFRLAYGRQPSEAESSSASAHVARLTAHHEQHKPVAADPPHSILRTMVEEMTGLNFTWEEQLDVYQKYVSDLNPTEVDPATRALADLCLVLMNSNEFVYIY